MKALTLKDVAEIVLNTEWNIDAIQTVNMEFENENGEIMNYGITVRNVLDCDILIVGLWGSGYVYTRGWDEIHGYDDISEETLVEFIKGCLNRDGFSISPKIANIELVDE